MMNSVKKVDIIKINNGIEDKISDEIVVENVLNINVNRKLYASLMCTPNEMLQLAIGFLFSDRVISSMKSIKSIEEKDENSLCIILKDELWTVHEKRRTLTSGCAGGSMDLDFLEKNEIKPIEGNCKYSVNHISMLMKEFNSKSELFKQTGGVHSCAICSSEGTLFFSEDIGRHNALDKVIGKALLQNVEIGDKLLMTTGRISSDITLKAVRAGIPIIISHSAPTDLALSIAKVSNMTMIGFARGNRMNIYCGEDRIVR
jgi:FdhD protein